MKRKTKLPPAGTPLEKTPDPPMWLGPVGREYWNRIAPLLVKYGLLTDMDTEVLATLCDWWEVYRTSAQLLRESPKLAIVELPGGNQQKSQHSLMRDQAYKALVQLWPKFGLTPEGERRLRRLGPGKAEDKTGIQDFARKKYKA